MDGSPGRRRGCRRTTRSSAGLQPRYPHSLRADGRLAGAPEFEAAVGELAEYEDTEFGGFGGAPKFPVAPVIGFLQDRADAGDERAGELAIRTLAAMAASPLRDPVEGGFFRYATQRDWSEPHYERMLYDNALLLGCYARIGRSRHGHAESHTFLLTTLRLPERRIRFSARQRERGRRHAG